MRVSLGRTELEPQVGAGRRQPFVPPYISRQPAGSTASGGVTTPANGWQGTAQPGQTQPWQQQPWGTDSADMAPAVAMAPAGYQPSSDDSYIYAAIGVAAPYTQAELTFAQAVESQGTPVSNTFTQAEIQAAYTAYNGNGQSVSSAITGLQNSLANAATYAATAETVAADGTVTVAGAGTVAGIGTTTWLLVLGGGFIVYMLAKK